MSAGQHNNRQWLSLQTARLLSFLFSPPAEIFRSNYLSSAAKNLSSTQSSYPDIFGSVLSMISQAVRYTVIYFPLLLFQLLQGGPDNNKGDDGNQKIRNRPGPEDSVDAKEAGHDQKQQNQSYLFGQGDDNAV